MLSELMIESLKQSKGLDILFFLKNNFRFEGKLLDCDGIYLKYYDNKKKCVRLEKLEEIESVELK